MTITRSCLRDMASANLWTHGSLSYSSVASGTIGAAVYVDDTFTLLNMNWMKCIVLVALSSSVGVLFTNFSWSSCKIFISFITIANLFYQCSFPILKSHSDSMINGFLIPKIDLYYVFWIYIIDSNPQTIFIPIEEIPFYTIIEE